MKIKIYITIVNIANGYSFQDIFVLISIISTVFLLIHWFWHKILNGYDIIYYVPRSETINKYELKIYLGYKSQFYLIYLFLFSNVILW